MKRAPEQEYFRKVEARNLAKQAKGEIQAKIDAFKEQQQAEVDNKERPSSYDKKDCKIQP